MIDILLAREGRIGRKQFWMGTLVLFAVVLLIFIPLMLFLASLGVTSLIIYVLIPMVLYYPVYCLYVKRQHDRGKDETLVIVYLVFTVIIGVLSALFVPVDLSDVNAAAEFAGNPMFWVIQIGNLGLMILSLYLLVVCGFFKGTDGSNQYGPDPLA